MRVKGVCALACCGALSRVRVSPCGARGDAGRSRAAVWKGNRENVSLLSHKVVSLFICEHAAYVQTG